MPLARTNTLVVVQTENGTIDIQKLIGTAGAKDAYCIDYAIENPITAAASAQLFGAKTLNPGDPMLSFGGYQGYAKIDTIPVTFTGGAGLLLIYITVAFDSKY